MNERQQITSATFGSVLTGDFGFDAFGYPAHSKAFEIGTAKQDYRYVFDPVTGNLSSRQNLLRSKSESFGYDNLERLETVTGPQNLSMAYAANGNILTKSDVGTNTFEYNHPLKPYALTDLESSTGVIPDVLQDITYTSFEQPRVITEDPYEAAFLYNSDGQRARMEVKSSGSTTLTRWYAGSRYIKETAGANIREFTWIGGDAYTAPVAAYKRGSTITCYALLRDYLGSITHLYNLSTSSVSEFSYDSFGRRRDKDTWSYTLHSEPELFAGRGFTSHEWLPWFNLYNMNGRLYDPVVGRFLSPDNFVQMPDNTQNFNRYSYALNNPLKFTDPDGEFFIELLNLLYYIR